MHNHDDNTESSIVEYAKFVAVIALIFSASYFIYSLSDFSDGYEYMRIFMGVFLVVFAGFKFAGYNMFVMMFQGYDLIAKKSKLYAQLYPSIELALGVLFLADLAPYPRNITVLTLMGVGAVGVAQEIFHKRSGIRCACLGNIIKLPLSTVSLVENVSMVAMASVMIVRMVTT